MCVNSFLVGVNVFPSLYAISSNSALAIRRLCSSGFPTALSAILIMLRLSSALRMLLLTSFFATLIVLLE